MKKRADGDVLFCSIILVALQFNMGLAAELGVTIYNQNFAVVRDTVPLELRDGSNSVRFAKVTALLEPSSVILRDPAGQHQFQVVEQNYRGDPVSQEMMMAFNEGKTIDFEIVHHEAGNIRREMVPGKIVRAGTHQPYAPGMQPIIDLNGKLRFGIPGQPIFPALADDSILKPTLHWIIKSDKAAKFDAEVSYVTGGMRWEADYNLVLPERGNTLDMVGWVTMDNLSGKSFQNARIKLMAGDVNKIYRGIQARGGGGGGGMGGGAPAVTEKSFDEYHLYTLQKATTLLDLQKKQVEFVHAEGVNTSLRYIYDGASASLEQGWNPEALHTAPEYGASSSPKVWVIREFRNSVTNQLGLPLPKGRLRVYRRDTGGQMEFTGEDVIDHTPKDELIRLVMGNSFDLIGERKQTDYKIQSPPVVPINPATGLPIASPKKLSSKPPYIDESFEIILRNHKKESAEVRVVEHLYRWTNWQITKKSQPYIKKDAHTIEFLVQLKPDEQQKVTYTVHYMW